MEVDGMYVGALAKVKFVQIFVSIKEKTRQYHSGLQLISRQHFLGQRFNNTSLVKSN